jgi:hypothetical protein
LSCFLHFDTRKFDHDSTLFSKFVISLIFTQSISIVFVVFVWQIIVTFTMIQWFIYSDKNCKEQQDLQNIKLHIWQFLFKLHRLRKCSLSSFYNAVLMCNDKWTIKIYQTNMITTLWGFHCTWPRFAKPKMTIKFTYVIIWLLVISV